jgi:FlaA1/EpsC-like NDP-sugar epimerase
MVRFGNVLGSSCSVVPIWSAQLVDGGPLTVTDPRMTRYFMTIHEAAGLVIQAAAIEPTPRRSRRVYVLDMGEPVRILDLARRFLAAHGYTPRLDRPRRANAVSASIPTRPLRTRTRGVAAPSTSSSAGIRPGEKLHEELAYSRENLRPTGCTRESRHGPRTPARCLAPVARLRSWSRARQSGDAS